MTGNLENALLDVRRAYRLIADYQQRMFELLGYIRDRLGAVDYHHEYVYPQPRSLAGLEKREDSGLRYLPFYDLSAIWLRYPHGQEAHWDNQVAGDLMFGAWIRSDTGFDKQAGTFVCDPAEQTRSELVLSVVICDKPSEGNWYHKYWLGIDYPEDGEVNSTDVPGYRCFSKPIPLAQLTDKAAVEAALGAWCADASDKLDTTISLHAI
ncbi:hypothetical protein A0O30_16635 [Pseudomonas sp. LLC-1]|uniref:hypothetical protein n=1 Tax=Pseudomonas sp. LLC-1 TaxID=1812180 RepID=UPI000D4C6337|nr:hypothetical protein [Pseudomonas sp. LLC-1]PRN03457.1 hypothetical protein A0O30_16635 [Pseudomonas sp. LLC-1]